MLAAHQPVEALLTLCSVVIVAARMEQITQDGFGVAIRDALNHWESFQSRSLGPEQIQLVASKVAEIPTQVPRRGSLCPTRSLRPRVHRSGRRSVQRCSSQTFAAKAGHGAALHRLRSGPFGVATGAEGRQPRGTPFQCCDMSFWSKMTTCKRVP